jgi:Domain of unknown function (DUF4160)
MPTVFKAQGFRFFFYSNDHLPVHIHVEKGNGTAKFNVNPVELVQSRGFNAADLAEIRNLVITNEQLIINRWYEHFGNQ